MNFPYADIAVPKPVDHTFQYQIPPHLSGQVEIGMRVKVPFGRQVIHGYVVGLSCQPSVEKIKSIIIEMIHYSEELPDINYSDYISEKLNYDYTYLSNIFSEVKGITIQQFIIIHKIEKAKELLLYDELNLTEISYKLHYSSVAHLSNQFKKITGLSPSFYTQLKQKRNSNLENM